MAARLGEWSVDGGTPEIERFTLHGTDVIGKVVPLTDFVSAPGLLHVRYLSSARVPLAEGDLVVTSN